MTGPGVNYREPVARKAQAGWRADGRADGR